MIGVLEATTYEVVACRLVGHMTTTSGTPVEIGQARAGVDELRIVGERLGVEVDRLGHRARLLPLHRGGPVLEHPARALAIDGLVALDLDRSLDACQRILPASPR